MAAAVAAALESAGLRAVLTGGGCATIDSGGEYQSEDLDLILERATSQKALDAAMKSIGFHRAIDRFTHSKSRFFVEFVRGPLSIGRDMKDQTRATRSRGHDDGGGFVADRLLPGSSRGLYHWNDRRSLETAVSIAVRRKVSIGQVRKMEHCGRGCESVRRVRA